MRNIPFLAVSAAAIVVGGYGAWVLSHGIEAKAW
jgi:hypothetical protein